MQFLIQGWRGLPLFLYFKGVNKDGWGGFAGLVLMFCVGCSEKKEGASSEATAAEEVAFRDGKEILSEVADQPQIEIGPGEDWASEQIAEDLKTALKGLFHDGEGNGLASNFEMAPLRPPVLTEDDRADQVKVLRGKSDELSTDGVRSFEAGVEALLSIYKEGKPDYELFKVFRVHQEKAIVETSIRFESSGKSVSGGLAQQRAVWKCEWQNSGDDGYLLRSIWVEDFEEVISNANDLPWFESQEASVLGGNSSWAGQLRYGLDHWLQRIEMFHGSFLGQRSGLAVGDINGDGLDDLYVPQPIGLPNCLFIHQKDGTVLDVSAESGADWLDFTSSALIVDLDNDGDGDLALATNSGVIVLENTGGASFVRRAVLTSADEDVESLTAIDYDGDSDLDLFLCFDYAKAGVRRGEPRGSAVLHNSSDGGANVLFASGMADGKGWLFRDATRESGLDFKNRQHSLAAAWEDYDNDGDPDLYVSNDYGHNCLYQNEGGKFTEVAAAAGVVDAGPGMSASWADYDRDGDMDLYVGNMFSSAGGRIFDQAGFRPWLPEEERGLYRRFVKGNSMFENQGDGTFGEVGVARGVETARWAWSSVFGDLNNDGWDDIVVANGYVTAPDSGDL